MSYYLSMMDQKTGLSEAIGECVVVIDCDLQHPPEKIVEMYHLWQEGYEVIEGVKRSRGKESAAHTFAASCFYGMIGKAAGFDMSHASDFKLLDRKAVNVLLNMREKNAFFRALSSWVGFKTTSVEFDVQVCDFQYHIFFNGTYADCYFSWGSDADIVCGAWGHFYWTEDFRGSPWRFYNSDHYSAFYRQHHYDQFGDYWLLYC